MNKKLSILLVIIIALSSCKKNNNNPADNTSNTYNTLIITTHGMYFEPSLLTCDIGDTIIFDLGFNHNALEVSNSNEGNNNNASFLEDGFYLILERQDISLLMNQKHIIMFALHICPI